MTKTKKLNKIIPAVLLSGAMVISTPHLISQTIANADGTTSSNVNNNGSKISLSDILSKEGLGENSKFTTDNNKILIDSEKCINVKLDKKYDKLEADLKTYHDYDCPLRFAFYFDNDTEANAEIIVQPIKDDDNKYAPHVKLNDLENVDNLRIEVTKANGDYPNLSFTGDLENAELTTK